MWSLGIILFLMVTDKIGIYTYRTYLSPITWVELYKRIPLYLAGGVIIFIVALIRNIKYYRKPQEQMYCINCRKAVPETEIDGICPICEKPTEPLKGIFERHPELK